MTYDEARAALLQFVERAPLRLEVIDRGVLEGRAANEKAARQFTALEQKCVNYLRHCCSAYDELTRKLDRADELCSTKTERHVLHVERRNLAALLKRRVLDEIAATYPWLRAECDRQKARDGVEDQPGEYVMPFGPFEGKPLRDLDADYLARLLGHGFVRKALRTRIERHLADRFASLTRPERDDAGPQGMTA